MIALFLASVFLTFFQPVYCGPSHLSVRDGTVSKIGLDIVTPTFDVNILRGYDAFVQDHGDAKMTLIRARPHHRYIPVDAPQDLTDIRIMFISEDVTWQIRSELTWGNWGDPEVIQQGYSSARWFKPSSLRIGIREAISIASRGAVADKLRDLAIVPKYEMFLQETKDPLYNIHFTGYRRVLVHAYTGQITNPTLT